MGIVSIRYHTSDMILKLHSNSSYLNAVGARSRQGGHLYLSNKSEPDILNGAVLNLAAIMKMVLSSAAEAEFGALFHNTKEATPLHTTLAELGHPQPPTVLYGVGVYLQKLTFWLFCGSPFRVSTMFILCVELILFALARISNNV